MQAKGAAESGRESEREGGSSARYVASFGTAFGFGADAGACVRAGSAASKAQLHLLAKCTKGSTLWSESFCSPSSSPSPMA